MDLAVIPARAGSTRVKRKNIRQFLGSPIIAYPIRAALQSGLFDHVLVSTDSKEIAEVAREHGAEVPFLRPAELATDTAITVDVLLHALQACHESYGDIDRLCCLYPTSVFVTEAMLQEGRSALDRPDVDGCFTVSEFDAPVQRALCVSGEGFVEPVWPENELVRSQDLEPRYHDAAQMYWLRASALAAERKVFLRRSMPIVVPRYAVQDIDDEDDWLLAELKFEALSARSVSPGAANSAPDVGD